MKTVTVRRLLVVLGVTLVSLWLIFPTIRYFLGVSGTIQVEESKLEELKADSVPLGLDLQGGVDVLLAIDTQQTEFAKITEVADSIQRKFNAESPVIEGSVDATSGTKAITVTVARQDQVRAADNTLTQMAQQGQIQYNSGSLHANQPLDVAVSEDILRQDMSNTVKSSIKVIRDRVDNLGVTQPIVVQQGNDRIRVQIPGYNDPEKAMGSMIRPAKLEFRGVYTSDQAIQGQDGNPYYQDASAEFIDLQTGDPLPGKRIPPGYESMPYRVTEPGESGQQTINRFILVKKRPEMTGSGLKDARVQVGGGMSAGEVEVVVIFNEKGTQDFDEASQKYMYKPLAMMLDGVVYSAPSIRSRINQGFCSITGNFSLEEAQNLSLILKAGALPAELITKDMRTVEATLGADSISNSIYALLLGSLLVGIYMIVYYGTGGVIAVVAVILNVLLIFAFMKLANATLTLSGIGGILLTVGMAVDANVLIYERIREELRAGKNMKQSIQLGFGKAFSVIFDANLTTLISGLVLLQFGEGSIKGFALSLNVGIIATLFTGLFVTKTLVDAWFETREKIDFGKLAWFRHEVEFDFLKIRNYAFSFSAIMLIICVVYVLPFVNGSNWGVDFEGGLLTEVTVNKEDHLDTQDVQGSYNDWRVQKVAGENQFLVRTKEEGPGVPLAEQKTHVMERLDETIGAGHYTVLSSEAVSSEVGKEFTIKAIIACVLASIGILIYLAFRFEFVFGVAAVLALFHDLVIAYGLFNILGDMKFAGEITLDVVAALLVVLGYSVNDTIIIFDRIRENRKLNPSMPDSKLINMSINESLNRTIMTVSTVVVVLLIMMIFGGSGLFDFALVLFIGIVMGTYSSVFVASPLLYLLHERARKKGKTITYRNTEQEVQPMLRSK